MKIKLDQNISRHVREVLVRLQHDVDTVLDEELSGSPDIEVLSTASAHHRILFTLDKDCLDFKKYPPGSHSGVVVFRPPRQGALAIIKFITTFVQSADLRKCRQRTMVVERTRIQVFK